MKKIQFIFVLLPLFLLACGSSSRPAESEAEEMQEPDNKDILFDLYYTSCDTVIRHHDTTWVVNHKFDTTIVQTGIYSYLPYDHPYEFNTDAVLLTDTALSFEKKGKHVEALTYFRKVTAFGEQVFNMKKDAMCDMNSYLAIRVNTAIMSSFAYDQLGDSVRAVTVLKPWLANSESHSGIYKQYKKACIRLYGETAWQQELNNCGTTLYQVPENNAPELDDWVVTVFGAAIGIGKNFNYDDARAVAQDVDRIISWHFCNDER